MYKKDTNEQNIELNNVLIRKMSSRPKTKTLFKFLEKKKKVSFDENRNKIYIII